MTEAEINWDAVKADFDTVMFAYEALLNVPGVDPGPALAVVFEPLLKRYESGERTRTLYDRMSEVE